MSSPEPDGRRPLRWGRFLGLSLVFGPLLFIGIALLGVGTFIVHLIVGLVEADVHANQFGEAMGEAVAAPATLGLFGGPFLSFFVATSQPRSSRRRRVWKFASLGVALLASIALAQIASVLASL